MPNSCPLCGEDSIIWGQNQYRCPNNHVWMVCPVHGNKVLLSTIGEDRLFRQALNTPINKCLCNMDVRYQTEDTSKPVQKPAPSIRLISPEGDFTFPMEPDTSTPTPFPLKEDHPINPIEVRRFTLDNIDELKNIINRELNITTSAKEVIAVPVDYGQPKPPSYGVPPLHISQGAKRLWKAFYKKYNETWRGKPLETKWATAIAIFRNYCVKRNVPPFDSTENIDPKSTEYMKHRVVVARRDSIAVTNRIIKAMLSKHFIDRAYRETINSVTQIRSGVYRIVTQWKLKNTKSKINLTNPDFRNWLISQKFALKNGEFIRDINGMAKVAVLEENGTLYVQNIYSVPQQLIAIAYGFDLAKMTPAQVQKKFMTHFKKTMKDAS